MAPDYAWWHGFYECKKRYCNFMKEAEALEKSGKAARKSVDFPNATGDKTVPAFAK